MSTNTNTPANTPAVETWEAKRDREKAESIASRRQLYEGVAAHLPGWSVRETEDEYLGYRFRLVDSTEASGPQVTIETGRERGKWFISGYWPLGESGNGYMSPSDVRETSPSIGVSNTKTFEQIAHDIKRRFLPEYLRVYGLLVAKKAERLAYTDRKRANWERVKASGMVDSPRGPFDPKNGYVDSNADPRADVRLAGKNGETNYDAGYGEVRMTGESSFELKLSSLPLERLLNVLRALKGGKS